MLLEGFLEIDFLVVENNVSTDFLAELELLC